MNESFSKLRIFKYPNPILRKRCEEIKEITMEIENLSQEMIKIIVENKGIGLAAPQVGELERIIVVQAEKGPEVFFNPKIIKKSKETEIGEEGCLSFPGLFLKIKRAEKVEVEALNIQGGAIQMKVEGLTARVFQHEIEHLDGILFIDKIGFWKRLFLKRRIKF